MDINWFDLNIEDSISDYEFTRFAVLELNRIISAEEFEKMDAGMIFQYLSGEMRIVRFNDFLKRYIYEKAQFDVPFETITDKEFAQIIVSSFVENNVPFAFVEKQGRNSSKVRKWLKRETVKRETIFLLGFGLKMSDADVSEFLTKVIQEDDFDFFSAKETCFWYCYRHGLSYSKAMSFLEYADRCDKDQTDRITSGVSFEKANVNPKLYLLTEDMLRSRLRQLKEHSVEEKRAETKTRRFRKLYDRVCQIIARHYNEYAQETKSNRVWKPEDIKPADIEESLCSGIPKGNNGNLQKMSASVLSDQFRNKRMDRQRISRLLSGKEDIGRFDLITMLFYIYAEEVEPNWPVERYLQFVEEANNMLKECDMMGIYPVNPYESFVMMCLVTDGPLDVYSEVFERSFERN